MKGFLIVSIVIALIFVRASRAEMNRTFRSAAPKRPISPTTILALDAYVQSSAFIESASAEVAGLNLELARTSGSENNGIFISTWMRNFSLPNPADGPTNLVVTFRAASGETAITNFTLTIASPPTLLVSLPFENFVVHSGKRVPIKATAIDEDSNVRIDITAGAYDFNRTNFVDVTIPVTTSGQVTFRARGNYDLVTSKAINIIVQSDPRLQFIVDAPGIILDADPARVLYHQVVEEKLGIKEIASGSEETIFQSSNEWKIASARLTPEGAFFLEVHPVQGYRAADVAAGIMTPLGPARGAPPQVAGNYVVWAGATNELFRRDLLARTNLVITNSLGTSGTHLFSVAENGDVTFSELRSEQIFRYRNGEMEQITTSHGFNNWTDGVNVLYFQQREIGPGIPLLLHTPGGTVSLSGLFYIMPHLNNGWVAFTAPSPQGYRLWVRTPTGALQDRAGSMGALALNSIGELFIGSNERKVFSRPDGSLLDFGNVPGRPIYRDENWEIILGNALFRLSTKHHTLSVQPTLTNKNNLFVNFVGTPGTSYQIQTASDLTGWTNHPAGPQTSRADGSIQIVDPIPARSRFYRALQSTTTTNP
jgi:hypothetical protein